MKGVATDIGTIHFIGIGGIGMSGIAEVMHNLGYKVQGSDVAEGYVVEGLRKRGISVMIGHKAENLGDAAVVVTSTAIKRGNPEVELALEKRIPVVRRAEMLAELMRLKYGIAIAGSHGKTTTTSLTAAMLSHAGLDPTVVVGGRVGTMGGSNARVGQSDFLVVESDESDGSFLELAPIIAVVTNIDREHLDHYANIGVIRQAFTDFVNKVPFYGAAILCLDDDNVQQILPGVKRRTVTYGLSAQADLVIRDPRHGHLESRFRLAHRGKELGEFRVPLPGAHNVLNATAVVAVGLELGVPIEKIAAGIETFAGVDRRFQMKGNAAGVFVIDDYGHHPTEVRATLQAARLCQFDRVLVLFQPHRYTRTAHLMDDFARAFHQADAVFITDIYAASEQPLEGVSGAALAERLRSFGHRGAEFVGTLDRGIQRLVEEARAGDAIITLGAGSVSGAGEAILKKLRGEA